ncbi:peptidase S8/S53 domain-containing protein [Sphaerosporella brunnea]|uniref:Peptidase S8/S53 domain-containing protein n=1 Tax=Sphaerosporella brunnea TaxID=1250544 RepID=A0A5J5F392_9PEZI|nr:peptidase S8/S53 domain-containing protein [Sphaerosporella brunnea]
MQLLLLVCLAISLSSTAGQADVSWNNNDNDIVGGRFIIEFADPVGLRKRAPLPRRFTRSLDVQHLDVFYNSLRASGIIATPRLNITSDVFDGISLHVENSAQIEGLKAVGDIKNVWPVRRLAKPKPIIHAVGDKAKAVWNSHENTGVLDLHAKGILGEGATVAIVDTVWAVDSVRFKVAGGTDIVGDDYYGQAFFPDPDPMGVTGHRTHVAGIVAASDDANFVSVAPKAKLLAYKVFGNIYNFTADDALVAAFVKAYDDGADVINASLGIPSGWPEGNDGATGPWYASSGSTGTEDIEVLDDACKSLPDNTPDLSNYLVLVRRGSCTFGVKGKNAVAAGANWIWFYNQPDMAPRYPTIQGPVSKGSAMISAADGEAVVKELAVGKNVTVSFKNKSPFFLPNELTGGKPEISTPGGNIYSTYPLALGGHTIFSGTSLSAPYATGVAALYIGRAGVRSKLGAAGIKELKAKLITSGNLVNFNNGASTSTKYLAPVAQQGGGYINAKKVFYDTSVFPGKLELNDTQYFRGEHYINIHNKGRQEVSYTLSHEAAGTINSFRPGYIDPQIFPPTFVNGTATVPFSTTRLTVKLGATSRVKITFTPPSISSDLFPIYSGAILITGSNGDTLLIPYLGVSGKMSTIPIWDLTKGEPRFLDNSSGDPLTAIRNFTLKGRDRPAAVLFSRFGAVENRWDIVSANWSEGLWTYPSACGGKEQLCGRCF